MGRVTEGIVIPVTRVAIVPIVAVVRTTIRRSVRRRRGRRDDDLMANLDGVRQQGERRTEPTPTRRRLQALTIIRLGHSERVLGRESSRALASTGEVALLTTTKQRALLVQNARMWSSKQL